MDFHRPVPVGDTVLIRSYVYDVGRTSVKVRLQAFRENPRSGEQERTTESRFVFVAIDEDGEPTEVGELDVESERGRKLREEALESERGGE
jgi:acyl-CoA hydrolase